KAQFAMDVKFPGLRTAVIARSPVFGGKVKSFDGSAAKAVNGVEQVVQVPSGVAVVAANFWSAKVGRDKLKIDWDPGPGASLDTTQLLASYREKAKTRGAVVVEKGDAGAALEKGKKLVAEAVQGAKAAGVPVKTVWTREDDIRGGYYRPQFLHRIEASLDEKGRPVAWKHAIVGQSILAGTPFESMMVKNGIDSTSIEGVVDSPYLENVPHRLVTLHSPRTQVPVLWWRSVGNTHTAFAMESMLDELA